ncbi:nucleotide exchange factor GrpE [Brooklawnia sp.]|uniref:nucleotide exchange factor GrpE n=1 Tax=Brooklawnia sp. TaxID=2699740 RepID=UPI00311E6433
MSEPVDQEAMPDEPAGEVLGAADLISDDAGRVAPADAGATGGAEPGRDEQVDQLKALVAERTEDLQRVHAEYVNYKKRVDRDRALARQGGVEVVLRDLLPVFDSISAAAEHDELTGGFKLTADELTKVAKSYGFEPFGIPGDEFDPRLHEALMQMPDPEATEMVVRDVMQQGYRINDLVVRPARVIVSVPAE